MQQFGVDEKLRIKYLMDFDRFINHFTGVDLIISKGQGNYETLNNIRGYNIFFMLISKCPVVAAALLVNIGDMVCKSAAINPI
jgi:hypothetical protein